MKTAIKLALVYFLMQILGALTAGPVFVLYVYVTAGQLDAAAAQSLSAAPSLLLGMAYMMFYLWRKKYLADDGAMYAFTPGGLAWSLLAGASAIFLADVLMSALAFLPDLTKQTFDMLSTGWPGILCVAVLGPVVEECLFRGAITKILLQKYAPAKAIPVSALVFGIIHINPAQVAAAFLMGILLAWIYWQTRSVVPCMSVHILNNSLSVILMRNCPEAETLAELAGIPAQAAGTALALLLLALSLKKLRAAGRPV